jgi:hypothetical protein
VKMLAYFIVGEFVGKTKQLSIQMQWISIRAKPMKRTKHE